MAGSDLFAAGFILPSMTRGYHFLLLFVFVLAAQTGFCQSAVTGVGDITEVKIDKQKVALKTTQAFGEVTVYSPSVIRVRIDNKPLGKDFSYSVIGEVQPTKATITQNANDISIVTDSLKIIISKKPFAITYYTPDGRVINEDDKGLGTSWAGVAVTTYKKMQDGERFVGLGEKTGDLDRKGQGYTNWNSDVFGYSTIQDPLYSSIPFYIGIHHNLNYGIFLDNTFQTDFNFGASNDRFSSFGARGGEMNYYFIYHKRVAGIVKAYTYLTGRMPMPPLWSLGYQQNRYSYYPDSDVLRVAHTLREKHIPADGITLDIHYMDKYQLFTWNKTRFPDPLKMNSELNKLGFKTTVIVDPGIKVEKGAIAYEDGLKNDVYVKYPDGTAYRGAVWPGWCNFTDFTSLKGRDWWHKQVNFFAQSGVSGIWNDMNEISTWGAKMPDNVLFSFEGKQVNHLEAHNVYGMEMARSSYEGALEHFKERPFILSRSGFAGLQRYSAIWTGDNRPEDDHMLAGVRLLNSLGLSGVSFTAMDIGGFIGNPSTDLYTRWMELGAFIPYYRNHAAYQNKSAEPWAYGQDALDIVRGYVNLRYQMLPYIYSGFYESTQTGMPLMRSLVFDNAFDQKIYWAEYENQYLFGNAFLVAPYSSTKDFGKLYLPEGTWYDLYNDAKQDGNQEKVIPLKINKLPVYVKGGSIIPMQTLVQTTAQHPADTLFVHVYNGTKPNTFVYYEDDGKSFKYKNGDYYKREIGFDPANRILTFGKVEGSFESNFKYLKVILHGFDQTNSITIENQQLSLNNGRFNFLNTDSRDDLQEAVYRDSCPVKSAVINNNKNTITIKY